MGRNIYKEAGSILIAGGIGGGMSIIVNAQLDTPILTTTLGAIPKSVLLGMFAAFIGVYVFANCKKEEPEAFLRCLGLALLCGVSPMPIIEAGQQLVTKHRVNQETANRNESVKKEVKDVAQVPKEQAVSKLKDITNQTVDTQKLANATGNPVNMAQAKENTTTLIEQINNLEKEGKITPEVKDEQVGLLKGL